MIDIISIFQIASQTQLAAISTSRSMDLNLITEEGDKVTLSLDAQAAALYTRSAFASVGEDGDYLYRQSELAAGQYQVDFSLSVEGDLNADILDYLRERFHDAVEGVAENEAYLF